MNDDKIKKYFLGKLNQAENSTFEEEFALDETLFEQAQMVESELIEQFLRRNLSASELDAFEKNYLITEERRKKVALAQNFLDVFKTEKTSEKQGFRQALAAYFQFSKALAMGGLAVLLFGIGFIFWLNSNTEKDFAELKTTNSDDSKITENRNEMEISNQNSTNETPQTSPSPNENINIKPSPTPAPKTDVSPKTQEQSKPVFATFTLLPGSLRSNGEQSIRLNPDTITVNLKLSLPEDSPKYQTYNATIKTADGETIATFQNLKSPNFNLPADKLSAQTYIIFLEGKTNENPAESISEYTFRVNRQKK